MPTITSTEFARSCSYRAVSICRRFSARGPGWMCRLADAGAGEGSERFASEAIRGWGRLAAVPAISSMIRLIEGVNPSAVARRFVRPDVSPVNAPSS